jgi:hypothetical protein
MPQDWVKVYSAPALYLVELMKGILEDQAIKTFVLNKRDSMHTHLDGDIELYVLAENVIRAKHLISKQAL